MADRYIINRINKFYGGIVRAERDRTVGASLNIEELDVFSNQDFIEPETIFETDSGSSGGIFDYAFGGSSLYGLSKDGSNKIKIWELTTAGADNPGNWSALFTSGNNFHAEHIPSMIWHEQTESSTQKDYLYYIGDPGGSNTPMYRFGDLDSSPTESSTDVDATAMTLTGITTSNSTTPFPRIRLDGEIFIGHGQFVAKVDKNGVFTEKAFTLPVSWDAISFTAVSGTLYILSRNTKEPSISKIFIWDTTATEQFDDVIIIPMGGAQAVINQNEVIRIFCAQNSILRIYELLGKSPIKTHELANMQDNTGTAEPGATRVGRSVPDNTVFLKDNVVYFGLWKTDKPGLYALGQTSQRTPLALVLSRRFDTTDYSNHRPVAATSVGPNFFAGFFDDNASPDDYVSVRIEGNNSPTRSSNAVYESVWIDAGSPETVKDWPFFFIVTKPIPTSCLIKVDFRVDNNTAYDTTSAYDDTNNDALDNANDFALDGGTADTFWQREINSILGRVIQVRLRFTSSTTSKATLFLVSLLSRENELL